MVKDFYDVAFGQIVYMEVSEHFLIQPGVGLEFDFKLNKKARSFSEESIEKSWGKESANESGSKNAKCGIGSQSDNMVGSPHGFVIHGIEVLKGNEKVTEVIDVENCHVDNSRLLKWIVSLFEWNSSVSSMKSLIPNPHGRMILASVEKGQLVWPSITEDRVTRLKEYVELTPAEAIQADCDIKAINIILQGLPTEIYALVSQHHVAKDLWENNKLLMQGTSLTKQERECKLI
ncbi:hypothetical protein Tco_0008713 [Tanacetum coccineum]